MAWSTPWITQWRVRKIQNVHKDVKVSQTSPIITGQDRQKRSSHDYYGQQGSSYSGGGWFGGGNSHSYYDSHKHARSSGGFGDLIVFGVVCIIGYALYKTCLNDGQRIGDRQYR